MTDQHLYDNVANELRDKILTPGLWTRAVAESGGDLDTARALYIRFRVAELREEERTESEHQRVAAEQARQQIEAIERGDAEERRRALEEMRANIRLGMPMTCIACRQTCATRRLDKGFLTIVAGLTVLFVIPGVLYLLFAKGHIFRCEHCGAKLYTRWN